MWLNKHPLKQFDLYFPMRTTGIHRDSKQEESFTSLILPRQVGTVDYSMRHFMQSHTPPPKEGMINFTLSRFTTPNGF